MSKVIDILKNYTPYNSQEEGDKKYFIKCEEKQQILTRDNLNCHLCSSAFIINKKRNKVLCIYHNIYKSWTWIGGHADGDDDMLNVAQKETKEETSLDSFKILNFNPISIDSLPVASHYKNNKFVPAHIHLNFAFLFEADEKAPIKIKPDENTKIAWLSFKKLLKISKEPHMLSVYKKIIKKIQNY